MQPCFEEFWDDFAPRFGLELGEAVRSNSTEPDGEVSESLVARILADNALDVELYEYAEQLYHARRAAR